MLGYGESCDAYHMSTPHPQGKGAALAMQQAIDRAGLSASDIDYVNLHGTSTHANDAAEDSAIVTTLGDQVPCSSTKGWTGHTLGAAGITEAIFCAAQPAAWIHPGNIADPATGPRAAGIHPTGKQARQSNLYTEQLVWLRRQQLQPVVWEIRMKPVFIQGVGITSSRAIGLG